MREGASGIYASVGGAMGFRIRMLNKTQMNGKYRDPYLTAVIREADAGGAVEDGRSGPFFIGGYVTDDQWMRLRRSGTAIRCAADGFVLKPPAQDEFLQRFEEVCADFHLGEQLNLTIRQELEGNRLVDKEDRIQAGGRLLDALVSAGL
jgi:hypothetical protein